MKNVILLVLLFLSSQYLFAQSTDIIGPPGSEEFGRRITVLPNGNYVVADPKWDDGATPNVGAVYLYDGSTNTLISTLTGSTADDQVGSSGVTIVGNSNYVVRSPNWDNGVATDAGAVTWGDGTSGVSGAVSAANSLVGSSVSDRVGNFSVIVLSNDNYVVRSPDWDNGATTDAGAVTWGDGNSGVSGVISASNSLVGSTASDQVGRDGITVLSNGNYVVSTRFWNNGAATDAGAVTWGDGSIGISGAVSAVNSLVGPTSGDQIGSSGIIVLSNDNFVVRSPFWNNGTVSTAGAVTWGDGNIGISGAVSASNSLVGSTAGDEVGDFVATALSNGNYVVRSPVWDNGTVSDAGAVTWGDGTSGVSGVVSAVNSLVGTTNGDQVGNSGITALSNGNYVVSSTRWDNGVATDAGAVTWGDGSSGVIGTVSTSNSLVGSTNGNQIGSSSVTALSNGNYVVSSQSWDNGVATNVGAVTWGDGSSGINGVVGASNSLVGSTANDDVGNNDVIALTNGNYVVSSPRWNNGAASDAGAVTWGDGSIGVSGVVSATNSLVGSTAGDFVGGDIAALPNGNYVVRSNSWANGVASNAGAVTWGDGGSGVSGAVSAANSLVGSTAFDMVGASNSIIILNNGNYIVRSNNWDNEVVSDAGAVTWGDGNSGISGPVSPSNSLIGSTANDQVGNFGVTALSNGNYLVNSQSWDNGVMSNVGAATIGNGVLGTNGFINSCNSVLGGLANPSRFLNPVFNEVTMDLLVGKPAESKITAFKKVITLADDLDMETRTIGANEVVEFLELDCKIIATLAATGASPISGDVTATVWIETTQTDFVKRHYEITPDNNAATATGTVTLYFTQAEFDDFNAVAAINLPSHPSDAIGIANLLIEKRVGTSDDGTGLPNSYDNGFANFDPNDSDVVWNANEMRWEVSLEVIGFSGFFVKTQEAILPVELLSFKAETQGESSLLTWATASEINNKGFFIERSENSKAWKELSFVAGAGTTLEQQNYTYTDEQPLTGINYYRLKQVDIDGTFEYSDIVAVTHARKTMDIGEFYPNPSQSGIVNLDHSMTNGDNFSITIFDLTGKLLLQRDNQISHEGGALHFDFSVLTAGIYLVKIDSQGSAVYRKLVIQE
ncbi:MAG: T9SS type A sorting domain-containing protein [Bacteroidota bacterium]